MIDNSGIETSVAKRNINFFVLGQMADIAITFTALYHLEGFREIGPAGSDMIDDEAHRLVIAKLAVTALLVGLYALSRDKNQKFEFIGRRSMELSIAIVYIVILSNVFQVAPVVIQQLGR